MAENKTYGSLSVFDGVPDSSDYLHIIRSSEANPSLKNQLVSMENALLYAATLEGPAGPTGAAGADGADGADGAAGAPAPGQEAP